jgi:hypothetical protein
VETNLPRIVRAPADADDPGGTPVSDGCVKRTCNERELHEELFKYGINIYGQSRIFSIDELRPYSPANANIEPTPATLATSPIQLLGIAP